MLSKECWTKVTNTDFPAVTSARAPWLRGRQDWDPGRCCRKRFFGGNKQNFLRLLMRFVRSDVGDHIASQKNDHGPSHRHYRASQRRGSPKITICEIFGVVRFST